MINKSIPHVPVLLTHKNPAEYPHYDLPEGYRFEAYKPGREEDWVRIQTDAELIDGVETARNMIEKEFKYDPEGMAKRMWFIIDPEGKAVATISMWYGGVFGPENERVHWVAVESDQQGKGLSNAMMTKAMDVYQEVGEGRPLFVYTQTWSYVAVRLYEKFGFTPYMGPKPTEWKIEGDFEEMAEKGWQIIRQQLDAMKR